MVEAGWARRAVCDRRFRVGAVALGTLALLTALAPWIAPYDPARQLDVVALKLLPPTLAHPFGTDPYSRDVLSRVLYGGAVSLGIALGATIVAFIVGLAWGLVAGWRGGWLDAVLMRVVDAGLAFPRALVLLLVVAWWGEFSPARLALVLGLSGWFSTSRFVRAEVRAARVLPHVLAARALGGSGWHVVRAHVVPAAISPALVAAAIGASRALTLEAGLAVVGLGIAPPSASWGTILFDGFHDLTLRWWLIVFPGAALVIASAAFTAIADALRESADPRRPPAD